jgi:hypothetical protein
MYIEPIWGRLYFLQVGKSLQGRKLQVGKSLQGRKLRIGHLRAQIQQTSMMWSNRWRHR